MKSKRTLMGFAAILILVFHFWITITRSPIESGIWRATYIGVDIFFFLSAMSLGKKNSINYPEFIKNRLLYIYLPFVIMAAICAVYKKWKLLGFIKVICGVEFFTTGGGAFLWFATAIMIIYLIAPLLVMLKQKMGYKALLILLIGWAVLVCVLQFVFSYTTIFILLNRLPIFFIGMYANDIFSKEFKPLGIILMIIGLLAGGYLLFTFGGNVRLTNPIADFYYIIAIPFTVSVIALFELIAKKASFRNVPFQFVGGITLELYGFQMIFGFDIETSVFAAILKAGLSMNIAKPCAILITSLCLILIAWIFSKIMKLPKVLIKR